MSTQEKDQLTGQALVKASDPKQLATAFNAAQKTLVAFLGTPEMAQRAARIAWVLVRRTPDLQKCSVESLVAGMLQSAQFGLELGTEAYLVPFKNRETNTTEAVFVPDWKGLVRLAIRAGALTSGHGDLVYDGDAYLYRRTAEGVDFYHERKRFGPRAKADNLKAHLDAGCQGVYFLGYPPKGPIVVGEMSVDDVEYVRKTYSKQPDSPLWTKRWSIAAIKTVAKQTLKLVPMSPQLREAIELDNRQETGIKTGVVDGDEFDVRPLKEPRPAGVIAAPREPGEPTEAEIRQEDAAAAAKEK